MLEGYCGVKCYKWEVYYGITQTSPVLIDESKTVYFLSSDGPSGTMFFFRYSDEIRVESISDDLLIGFDSDGVFPGEMLFFIQMEPHFFNDAQ